MTHFIGFCHSKNINIVYKISDHFSCFQFHHARSSALNDRLLVLVIQVFSLEDGNLISLNFF